MHRIVITMVIIMATIVPCRAGEVTSTIEVVTRSMEGAIDSALRTIPAGSRIQVSVDNHPDARWLESTVMRLATEKRIVIATEQTTSEVSVVVNDLSTKYEAVGSADSIRRVVTTDVSFIVTSGGERRVVQPPAQRDVVTCLRRDALAAESAQHASTHGEMPAEERTLWDDVLEPAIFVVAAVATVVLLFTVRSQ